MRVACEQLQSLQKGCILVIIFVMRIETVEMVLWDGIE